MKRMIRCSSAIRAAEETDDRLDEALSNLKDDFDYIVSGLEKLGRAGANSTNDALAIAETLSNNLQGIIDNIANVVSNGNNPE